VTYYMLHVDFVAITEKDTGNDGHIQRAVRGIQ
jgi:hypothetical protein